MCSYRSITEKRKIFVLFGEYIINVRHSYLFYLHVKKFEIITNGDVGIWDEWLVNGDFIMDAGKVHSKNSKVQQVEYAAVFTHKNTQ